MALKGKNRFTSFPNILRSVPKTDKEKGLRREEGRNRPVCSLVRRSSFVRGDMVASSVDPASSRGRAEVPVWWNGSRVIEILCSLPSRYDVCGGLIPYRLFLSFSLLAVSPSLSSPPLSFTPVISSSESSCYSFSRKDIRTRSRVTSVEREREQVGPSPKLPARDYKPIISSQILRRASCGPKPAWLSLSPGISATRDHWN